MARLRPEPNQNGHYAYSRSTIAVRTARCCVAFSVAEERPRQPNNLLPDGSRRLGKGVDAETTARRRRESLVTECGRHGETKTPNGVGVELREMVASLTSAEPAVDFFYLRREGLRHFDIWRRSSR